MREFIDCLICNSRMEYYFSKTFAEKPESEFMEEFEKVDYFKCESCGFVFSRTHAEMETQQWERVNEIHHYWESKIRNNLESGRNEQTHQPPYLQQATMVNLLQKNEILSQESILDYAGGYGTLQTIFEKYYGVSSLVYDPFVNAPEKNYVQTEDLGKYKTVLNSAMFEHIRSRKDLDNVNELVEEDAGGGGIDYFYSCM